MDAIARMNGSLGDRHEIDHRDVKPERILRQAAVSRSSDQAQ